MNKKLVLLVLCLCISVIAIGCQVSAVEKCSETAEKKALDYEKIYSYRSLYIGDAVKTSGLIRNLHFSEHMQDGIALQTDTEPYGLSVVYTIENPEDYLAIDSQMLENAAIIFSLIDNSEKVVMKFTDGNDFVEHYFERSAIKQMIGIELSFFGRDYDSFSNGLIPVLEVQEWKEG